MGGIQPSLIQRIAKNAAEDGLLQRCLFIVANAQAPGVDRKPAVEALQRYDALIPALEALHPELSSDGQSRSMVAFHADAHQHREDIDGVARAMAAMPYTSPRQGAALGKWPGIFAKLALTFHLIELADARAQGDVGPYPMVIPERVAGQVAAFMLDFVLPHMLRAENLMFATVQAGHARWLGGFILSRGLKRITTRDVVRSYRALASPENHLELLAVMASLVTVGWLEPEVTSNPAKPVSTWVVNPAVHPLFAARAEQERRRRERVQADMTASFEVLRRKRAERNP